MKGSDRNFRATRLHTQKDKERRQRIESDIQWGLIDPESGEGAQARGRPARDRGLALPKTMTFSDDVLLMCDVM